MKIIFLDIDDVINIHWRKLWDKKAILNLNDIIKLTNSKIVIISTWRIKYNLEELREIFIEQGIIGEIISTTPILNKDRGIEILDWLDKHKEKGINKFAIIDDKTFYIEKHIDIEHIFRVEDGKGLRDMKIKDKIINYLNI